ncbi:sporulation integral membrane protein YtvI [Clostridia bacterium]|nr:sporulation integral membrane protein YtvI [Clostridia bacterium]
MGNALKLLLSATLPFLIGLALSKLAEPVVRLAVKRAKMPRWAASAVITLALSAAAGALVWLILSRALYEAGKLLRQLPELMTKLPDMSRSLSWKLETIVAAAPPETQEFLRSSFDKLLKEGIAVPGGLYSWLGEAATWLIAFFPAAILFSIALALSVYFISSDYPKVTGFIARQIPQRWRERVFTSMRGMTGTLGKWLAAQGTLMLITAAITLAGLLVLRVDYVVIMTAVVAAVDALPVLGAGLILVPWALFVMLTGDMGAGIGLLVLWAVLMVVRGVAEPRLVGDRLGLHPLVSLLSMYAGFQLFGVAGMILCPFAAIMLVQLNRWGYIKLWR